MIVQKEYLSQAKYDELKDELDFLKSTRRKEIAKDLEYSRSLGDLSENAEYHQARELQAKTEGRIFQLENILKSAEIISKHKSNVVEVGSTVAIRREKEREDRMFEVVGSEEADTAAGKVSPNSPLGAAMMGKKKKETFTVNTPSGKEVNYTIVKIE